MRYIGGQTTVSLVRFSILDFGQTTPQCDRGKVMRNTLCHAVLAEQLGYSRYWFSEHHEMGTAWTSPELIMALALASTKTIKIGAAGFLLLLHQPYRLAQLFIQLQSMAPGRIDFGFAGGLAPKDICMAIDPGFVNTASEKQKLFAINLEAFFNEIAAYDLRLQKFSSARASFASARKDVWILGASGAKRKMASENGLPFCYSLMHLGSSKTPVEIETYFQEFRDVAGAASPQASIAVSIICAESNEEVNRRLQMWTPALERPIHGNRQQCLEQLHELADQYQVSEIVIAALGANNEAKEQTYRLLASVGPNAR